MPRRNMDGDDLDVRRPSRAVSGVSTDTSSWGGVQDSRNDSPDLYYTEIFWIFSRYR